MWLLYVVFFVLAIFAIDHLIVDQRQLKLVKHLNSPLRLPIIGHAWILFGVKPKDIYKFALKAFKNYSGNDPTKVIYGVIGPNMEFGILSAKHIEQILTSPAFLSKSSLYNFLEDVLGNGLLFSTDQKWFNRRRIITPTFHFKILEQFFDVFEKQNKILINQLKEKANGEAFDIFPFVSLSVLKSLCETAMGCEITCEDYTYLNAVKELTYHVATSFLSPLHRIRFIYNLTPTKRKQDKCAKILHDFTMKMIEKRRELLKNNGKQNLENLDDDDVGLKKRMCLLDVLLQSTVDNKPLSNADIQEEVDTFTFAGHDTSSTATGFTLYLISKYPDCQQKILKEIEEVIGDGELTFKSLNEFKYLELVIKESMRLYPPVPIISRRLREDFDFGDFIGPANANFNLSLFQYFRDPSIYEEPNEFIPERFLKNIPPLAFVPFSAGQRNCIGQKFAMINMKCNIINILRNFELLPGEIEPELLITITLKSNGIFLKLREK